LRRTRRKIGELLGKGWQRQRRRRRDEADRRQHLRRAIVNEVGAGRIAAFREGKPLDLVRRAEPVGEHQESGEQMLKSRRARQRPSAVREGFGKQASARIDQLREPPQRLSPAAGPALQEVDIRSLTVFEVRRPAVMRKHGQQKGLERVASPGFELLRVEQLSEVPTERPTDQWLERREMPRDAPELRYGLGAKAEGALP
jgi:hypothetical protein